MRPLLRETLAFLAGLFLGLAISASAQTPQTQIPHQETAAMETPLTLWLKQIPKGEVSVVMYGTISDSVRKQLEQAWDDTNPKQVERGYCITSYSVGIYKSEDPEVPGFDLIFRVWAIGPGVIHHATHDRLDWDCPQGDPEIHIHTPTTCDTGVPCQMGGEEAFDTDPSRFDIERVMERALPFGVIQADRHVFRFYFPQDLHVGHRNTGPDLMPGAAEQNPKTSSIVPQGYRHGR